MVQDTADVRHMGSYTPHRLSLSSERGDARLPLGGSETHCSPLIGSQHSAAKLGRGSRLRANATASLTGAVSISVADQTNRLSIIDAN